VQGIKRVLMLFIVFIFLTGCSVLNPYHSQFSCPDTYNGKCVPLKQAYEESKKNVEPGNESEKKDKKSDSSKNETKEGLKKDNKEKYTYRTELYKEISNILKQPSTPFVVPPKVMRVLILPYTTKSNTLEMSRYVYFFATPPRWVLNQEGDK